MFEKDAEEIMMHKVIKENDCIMTPCKTLEDCQLYDFCFDDMVDAFKDGAEFGYNKANEWHHVKDGDLPKEDLRPRTLGYYLTASKHKSYKGFVFEVAYFTGVIFTKGGDILDNVIAWKEIVLPKESE